MNVLNIFETSQVSQNWWLVCHVNVYRKNFHNTWRASAARDNSTRCERSVWRHTASRTGHKCWQFTTVDIPSVILVLGDIQRKGITVRSYNLNLNWGLLRYCHYDYFVGLLPFSFQTMFVGVLVLCRRASIFQWGYRVPLLQNVWSCSCIMDVQ